MAIIHIKTTKPQNIQPALTELSVERGGIYIRRIKMAYSFMRIEKIKSVGGLVAAYRHDYRKGDTPNADKTLAHLNDEIVSTNGKTYLELFNEKMSSLEYYNTHAFRKNGIMAIEVVTVLPKSEENNINVEQWKQDNLKWLRDTFNACPEKYGDNIISMVYHADEAGSTHCHAIVVPVDDKGKINLSHYLDKRQDYVQMQTSYGRLMKKRHGLERGVTGSKAKHKDIARFYTELNNAVYGIDPPVMKKGETIDEYQKRVAETMKNVRAASLREIKERDTTISQIRAEYKNDVEKDMEIISLQKELRRERKKMEGLEHEFGSISEISRKCRTTEKMEHALNNYPDEKKRSEVYSDYVTMLKWAEEDMKNVKKKKTKNKEKPEKMSGNEI